MKDLKKVSKEEQKAFFKSFDQVLCDVDGVLWNHPETIQGSREAITYLKNQGKKIIFVSNKTSTSHDDFCNSLRSAGFSLQPQELVMPEVAIVAYLKKINFEKEIYFVGMSPLRDALTKAGFTIANVTYGGYGESISQWMKQCLHKHDKVGAVITDLDYNLKTVQLQKAAVLLKKPDMLFITGNSSGRFLNAGPGRNFLNASYFDQVLEDFTGRKVLRLAKPSLEYNEFIKEKHQIGDPTKVLVIGDSVEDDLAFASNCGYRKLLVLSGVTSGEDLKEWKYPEEHKPEYFVDSLNDVYGILKQISN